MAPQETWPLVVFGAPRSGTTYLIRVLNSHPQVYVSGESRLFVWAHRSLRVLTEDRRNLLAHREKFLHHLVASYPALIRDFYRSVAPAARWWGDKNPHYGAPENEGCLETIRTLFPEARFVHIIRDGREVAASYVRKGWGTFEGILRAWPKYLDIGCGFGAMLPEDQYIELRYEDLIRDDLGVARQVFDRLAIAIDPAVASFCEAQRRERTPFSDPTRDLEDVAEPRWRSVLTPEQQFRSLEVLGTHLVRFGYETEASLATARAEAADRLGAPVVAEEAP